MKKVVVANDHGAVDLAKKIVTYLEQAGFEVDWLGTQTEESVDYPQMAKAACKKYLDGGYEFGVLCCGTGIGISISANKIKGIRCALLHDSYSAEKTKEHNHSNFIAFGGRIKYAEDPIDILKAYINAVPSEDPRHLKRLKLIEEIEQGKLS